MARSRSIGGIYASLSLRDGGFQRGLRSASRELKDFGAKALKGAAVGVGALAAGMAAAAVVGTKSTLSMVDDLGDVSAQTGIAVADMMRLQQAYKDGGREASAVGKDIGKMQKAIVAATEGGDDPFRELGISAKDLMLLDPAQQFQQVGDAIMRIENPAKRTAKAMEIFGKGGMGLTTVFGGIDGAVKSLGKMPEIAQKFAGAMGEANDLLGRLPVKSEQFFVGFTAGIIGELLPQLQRIDDYDLSTLGMSVGSSIATGFQGLLDGSIFEIIALKFTANMIDGIGQIQSFLTAAITEAGEAAWKNTTLGKMLSSAKGEAVGYNIEDILGNVTAKMENPYSRLTEAMTNEADGIYNTLRDRMKANSDKAAEIQGGAGGAVENPIILNASAIEIPKIKSADPMDSLATVNDYQRRGLSLNNDANASAMKLEKQLEEAKKTNALLEKLLAIQPGELYW